MQNLKTLHTFFSLCRSSILNLLYLYNFRSPRSEISSCGSPLSPLSNPRSLIKIGFSKEDLCQISHDDLIIEWFSRANLYEVPRVTISTWGPKTDTKKTIGRPICINFYEISIWCLERKLWWFSQDHLLGCNSGACKNPKCLGPYLWKYSETRSKIWDRASSQFRFKWVSFSLLKICREKFIAKIPRWPVWSSETLESKALIPNVMKLAHKIKEMIDLRLQNQPLWGGNLLYIT